MRAKPKHLGPEYAAQFADESVAGAYHHRIPYPPDVFAILAGLLGDGPRAVLDVGCGTGEIARPLLPLVDRIDAVDPSAAMIAQGRTLPGGDDPRLRWITGRAEDAPLAPPYGLITAGSSIHWLDWDVALPRFRRLLAAGGYLALLAPKARPAPWVAELQAIIDRYSTNRDYAPYDIVAELTSRGLFHVRGTQTTVPIAFTQPLAAYIESFHAMNGFSRDRMPPEAAAGFDAAVRALAAPFCPDGQVHLEVTATVTWGVPGRIMVNADMSFRSLKPGDYPLLLDWLQRPHVKEWWDDGDDTLDKVAAHYSDPDAERFILLYQEAGSTDATRPIGYFQYYLEEDDVVGIDQFIGEADLLNRGLGTAAVRAFLQLVIVRQNPRRIILDPAPENARAIRCYEKAGFRHYETATTAEGKQAYMMKIVVSGRKPRPGGRRSRPHGYGARGPGWLGDGSDRTSPAQWTRRRCVARRR